MKAQIVSFHCVLKNKMGKVLSSTFNQDVITGSLNQSAPLKGLADALKGLKKGERRRVSLAAEEAYGFYDQRLVIEVPRAKQDPDGQLSVGMEILVSDGGDEPKPFRVVALTKTTVSLDGNHPLAGQDLEFEIEATAARDATSAELLESDSPIATLSGGKRLH